MLKRLYISPADQSWFSSWEISPCREYYCPDGGTFVEVVESIEDLEVDPDIGGELFYGVYLRLSEAAISRGSPPAIHVRDFDTRDEALAFVHALVGPLTTESLISGAGEYL